MDCHPKAFMLWFPSCLLCHPALVKLEFCCHVSLVVWLNKYSSIFYSEFPTSVCNLGSKKIQNMTPCVFLVSFCFRFYPSHLHLLPVSVSSVVSSLARVHLFPLSFSRVIHSLCSKPCPALLRVT